MLHRVALNIHFPFAHSLRLLGFNDTHGESEHLNQPRHGVARGDDVGGIIFFNVSAMPVRSSSGLTGLLLIVCMCDDQDHTSHGPGVAAPFRLFRPFIAD